jgi:multidrug efflux pump subunit AcrA (membrane-fusion protein)
MNKNIILVWLVFFLFSCGKKVEKTHPVKENISESVYASGLLKSKNQYQVFATVSGILQDIYVSEGDAVKKGTPLLTISNETSKLNTENAQLAADFADVNANADKLNELKYAIDFSKSKMSSDSLLLERQRILWAQQIGSKLELEQRELSYQNSKTTYEGALLRYNDLKKQIAFSSAQSKKNLQISKRLESDFTIKSEIDGKVYIIYKEKGEMVNAQSPLAVVGNGNEFVIEMQIDERDIVRIKNGQTVMVTLDSYKDQLFEAIVNKVDPIMNERSKTFTAEASFTKPPLTLYPNLTLEANIVIQEKEKVLTIPRKFIINEEFVVKESGDTIKIKTGLKDYQRAEILSGLTEKDEIIIPSK